MAEFALDFINVEMVGWGLLVFLGYFLVRRYVRVTFFTIVYFLGAVTMPWVQSILPERAPVVTADAGGQAADAAAPVKAGVADAKTVGEWYDAFLAYERDRRARFPNGLSEKDTPFDILLLSIWARSRTTTSPFRSSISIRSSRSSTYALTRSMQPPPTRVPRSCAFSTAPAASRRTMTSTANGAPNAN